MREQYSDKKVIQINSVEELAKLYGKPPQSETISAVHHTRKSFSGSDRTYNIYTAGSLSKLIKDVKRKYEQKLGEKKSKGRTLSKLKSEEYRSIRYLLTEDNEMLFAEEGNRPAHSMMTGEAKKPNESKCCCAGNLVFNEDFSKIVIVNNKSGDFRPEAVLLKKALVILFVLQDKMNISISHSLNIQHYISGSIGEKYSVSIDLLKGFATMIFSDGELENFAQSNKTAKDRVAEYPRAIVPQVAGKRKALFGFFQGKASHAPPQHESSSSSSVDFGFDHMLLPFPQLGAEPGNSFPPSKRQRCPNVRRSLFGDGLKQDFDIRNNKTNIPSELGNAPDSLKLLG